MGSMSITTMQGKHTLFCASQSKASFVHSRSLKRMAESGNQSTSSIVTTAANSLMQHIHNNPKLKAPRMPVMHLKGLENAWLHPIMDYADKKGIKELIAPLPDGGLAAYPVARLRGKEYQGNVEGVSKEAYYADLNAS
jgi:putative SOS response-associated peptidase YedK